MSAVTWAEIEPTRELRPVPGRRHLRAVPDLAPSSEGSLVLTRRGRLALTLVAAAIVVATAFGLFSSSPSAAVPTTGPMVTVAAGQTLSQIAAHELPAMSVADGVAAIQIANNLSSTEVNAGQHLVIPKF